MRLLVTGATGFLGWRTATCLRSRGHDVVALVRPGHAQRVAALDLAQRAEAGDIDLVERDAGDPTARDLVAGCDAVLHFAGVPDPARSRADPARAVRENAGTTVNLLEGCDAHGAGLILPSTARAGAVPPPDPYALSKRLAEDACLLHRARATVVRLSSVFGPGQVEWEGATGAIAAFAARAIDGRPIAIPGDPRRTRDFLYVDDLVDGLEQIVAARLWDQLFYAGSGEATTLLAAAEMACEAAGVAPEIELPGGDLPPGENDSYGLAPDMPRLELAARPLREAVAAYVDWLRMHPAAQGRT
jgi:nucleoside-diphosphate-sugar epimerase